ncbi:MAG: PD-(D/E)XK nuclease domain-containing protein, partial [Succinivibrio sp.]|nr:PD-(D/E)XK nuclease domain-containing protein [Succinivibrio sp.]
WYEAGGLPSILKNYLDTHELNAEKLLEGDFAVSNDDFLNPTSLITINQSVLMCQTGYLTLKSPLSDECPLMLGIANKEVATALAKLVSAKFMKKDIFVVNAQGKNILKSGTAGEIIELFNSVLLAISYDKYPVNNESTLRAMLHSFLMGRNQNVRAESHNAKGRSDLIVDFAKRRVVFEFKFSKDGQDADTKLNEAVSQLESRDYGRENLNGRELIRLACVFNADHEKRVITKYKAL